MQPELTELFEHLRPTLSGKRILLGVSGSIAAFKACDMVRYFKSCGASVRCVLTPNGARFVTPLTLENLSGEPVSSGLWDTNSPYSGTHHIDAARWADLALVAPATANTIAKLAHGMADDLLSTELLAFQGKLLIAPAMNPAMFAHPATQANLQTLRSRGAIIVGPTSGVTSCGELGEGRMFEPETIAEHVARAFYPPSNGRRLLVTLGPTQSALDPVRYLTNRSSGKMGASIAWAARRAGFEVTAIAGPCSAVLPSDIRLKRVKTATEMSGFAQTAFQHADAFVSAAAVLDWEISNPGAHKLKKESGAPVLEFVKTPDILRELSAQKRADQFVLGFAAETRDVLAEGTRKRLSKSCDALFANDVSREAHGFESSMNGGWWIDEQGVIELPVQTKSQLADTLIGWIEEALDSRATPILAEAGVATTDLTGSSMTATRPGMTTPGLATAELATAAGPLHLEETPARSLHESS